jgi:catechol 2,3-dioxygenase
MGMVSAGGYHHHIGFNTWVGEGAPQPPTDALGLRYFSFVLPDKTELERVIERVRQAGIPLEQTDEGALIRDPSGLSIVLNASGYAPTTSGSDR